MIRRLVFTETASGVTYTAHTSIPAGARLLDVYLETTVAWTAATAPVDVGDADAADALVSGGLLGADLAAQQGEAASGKGGTNWGNGLTDADGPISAGGPGKLYPNGGFVTAVVSPTVPGGPTGVSYITLLLETASVVNPAMVV